MQFVTVNEALKYEQPNTSGLEDRYGIPCELAARLKELDRMPQRVGTQPLGVRFISRLVAIERKSRSAYRLVLDLLSDKTALSESLKTLGECSLNANGGPISKQAYLQQNRKDIEIINDLWPEIAFALKDILIRRRSVEGEETWVHICEDYNHHPEDDTPDL